MDLLHGGIQITDKKITLKGCCKLLHEIYESNRTSLRLFSDERQFTIFHWVKWQSCLHLVLLTSTCGILSTEIVAINSFGRLFSTSSIMMSMLWQGSSPMMLVNRTNLELFNFIEPNSNSNFYPQTELTPNFTVIKWCKLVENGSFRYEFGLILVRWIELSSSIEPSNLIEFPALIELKLVQVRFIRSLNDVSNCPGK